MNRNTQVPLEAALSQQVENERRNLAAARMGTDVDKIIMAYSRFQEAKARLETARGTARIAAARGGAQ